MISLYIDRSEAIYCETCGTDKPIANVIWRGMRETDRFDYIAEHARKVHGYEKFETRSWDDAPFSDRIVMEVHLLEPVAAVRERIEKFTAAARSEKKGEAN